MFLSFFVVFTLCYRAVAQIALQKRRLEPEPATLSLLCVVVSARVAPEGHYRQTGELQYRFDNHLGCHPSLAVSITDTVKSVQIVEGIRDSKSLIGLKASGSLISSAALPHEDKRVPTPRLSGRIFLIRYKENRAFSGIFLPER